MKVRFGFLFSSCCWSLALVLLFSCSKNGGGKNETPGPSVGLPSEVLLVLDRSVMTSDLKDTLVDMLTCNVPALNQGEDFFRLSCIPLSMHERDFLRMHSKLIVKISADEKEARLGEARNVNAAPQLQLQLTAPSLDALRAFLPSHADQIRDLLLDGQLSRQKDMIKKKCSQKVSRDLKEVLGCTAYVPKEIAWTKKGVDFLWGSSRRSEKQLNVVFYSIPYAGQSLVDVRQWAEWRDSVMRVNIPGSTPEQWMETVWEGDEPCMMLRPRMLDGKTCFEMRGLWQLRAGAMGGPFVALAQLDTVGRRVLVGEGFVYSPSTTKRDLVRTLEASLRTFGVAK